MLNLHSPNSTPGGLVPLQMVHRSRLSRRVSPLCGFPSNLNSDIPLLGAPRPIHRILYVSLQWQVGTFKPLRARFSKIFPAAKTGVREREVRSPINLGDQAMTSIFQWPWITGLLSWRRPYLFAFRDGHHPVDPTSTNGHPVDSSGIRCRACRR